MMTATVRGWFFVVLAITFTILNAYNSWYTLSNNYKYNRTNVHLMNINATISVIVLTYNLYRLGQLYYTIYCLSSNLSNDLWKLSVSFCAMCTFYLISWCVCCFAQYWVSIYWFHIHYNQHEWFNCYQIPPLFVINTIILNLYVFFFIGEECVQLKQYMILVVDETIIHGSIGISSFIHGSPFILLFIRTYSLALAYTS
eukprot:112296_1